MSETGDNAGRSRRYTIIGVVVVVLIVLLLGLLRSCLPRTAPVTAADASHPHQAALLSLGDVVMTGFSGTEAPAAGEPLPKGLRPVDQTFIDTKTPAARIFNPRKPGFVWDGRYWAPPRTHDIPASAIGQVFGVTLDNTEYPNIYLTATSLYGLNIVVPPPRIGDDGRPTTQGMRRSRTGRPDARWMAGQFGNGGGPGTIWKIDGRTGEVVHFADVSLNGQASGPAALGNIAYDAGHQQLFVSDLSTGMIHRIGLNGEVLGQFDHGVTALRNAHLAPVPYNRAAPGDIHDERFNSEDPRTWGFALAARRPFGLAVYGSRLYYAVADGRIWSVGLAKSGDFTADTRWEIDVPGGASAPAVSDIVFTHDGTMIVAQRAVVGTSYDYKALPADGVAHVYRFRRETPKNPNTPSDWYQQPEEYAVGYAGDNRNSAGGVALGYGYKSDGTIDFTGCEDALFFTGDLLRDFHAVRDGFGPTGPLQLYGLQASPSAAVRGFNTPPAISYFVNYTDAMGSADARGTVGDVAVYRIDCKDPGCKTPPESSALSALPAGPAATQLAGLPPDVVAPPPPPPGSPANCVPGSPGCVPPCVPGTPSCGSPCIPGTPGCGPACIPGTPGCGSPCLPGMPDCCIGAGCTPPQVCMTIEGHAVCDTQTGQWTFQVTTTDPSGIGIDMLTVFSATPGVSVSNGPDIGAPPGIIDLIGASSGQNVTIGVCGFNNAARGSGAPYDCCRQVLKVRIPHDVCTKAGGG